LNKNPNIKEKSVKTSKIGLLLRSIVVILVILIAGGFYCLFTTSGSSILARLVLAYYFGPDKVKIEGIEGALSRGGLKLENIEIDKIPFLPHDSSLKIQELMISLRPFKFDSVNLGVENCRLILPYSEPIVLFAGYKGVQLDVNVYSRKIDVEEVLRLFTKNKDLKDISGAITNVDSAVKGSFTHPQLTGIFEVERLSYKDISLTNAPGSFAVNLKAKAKESGIQGALVIQGGSLIAKDIQILLNESKLIFLPGSKEPLFDIRGVIERKDINIKMVLRGSLSGPILRLTSEPEKSENLLAYAVLKGKDLQDTKYFVVGSVNLGTKLSKEILNYFLAGSDPAALIASLGVSESPLQFEPPPTSTTPQGSTLTPPAN
jgi:hypothetical protein